MKVLLLGASGMIGQGVLLECLDHPHVESVLVVLRSASGREHPKLTEIVHGDFYDWSSVEEQLTGYDACLWCLGVSAAGMSEEAYTKITYELTMATAPVLARLNPGMTMCFVSGSGTDSTEQGRAMWARVKGRAENADPRAGDDPRGPGWRRPADHREPPDQRPGRPLTHTQSWPSRGRSGITQGCDDLPHPSCSS